MRIESRRAYEVHVCALEQSSETFGETRSKHIDLSTEGASDVLLAKCFSGHTTNCLPSMHSPSFSCEPSPQESQSSYSGPPQVRQAA